MSAVRWWFILGAALHLAGAASALLAARAADADGRWFGAGCWTALAYLNVLAALGNAGLLWLGGDDDNDKGGE